MSTVILRFGGMDSFADFAWKNMVKMPYPVK
jgi:hypothetical protein